MKTPSKYWDMYYKIPFYLLILVFLQSWGQTDISDTIVSNLVIKHRVTESNVLLRWGAVDKTSWKLGVTNGYIVERITLERDDKPILDGEVKVLTGGPIKPKPLAEWEVLVQTNDMAALAAQAIYGDSFSTNSDEENLLMQVVNESSELDQRFAFSMFTVDQDFKVAQYAGLGFVDTTVKNNEKYLYNIRLANVSEELIEGNTGVLVDPTEPNKLPKPFDFAAYYYNNAFVLIWEYDSLLEFYTSYDLERSEDGSKFVKVNEAPITKLAVTDVTGVSYTDSIPEYGKKYWYRIKGRTLFDETGPVSDTVSVIGFKELLAGPEVKESKIFSEKQAILNWDFPMDEAWKLASFDILRADKAIGPYGEVVKELGKDIRTFEYNELRTINYFKIRAQGIAGDHQDSSPIMVQPVDSVPPEKPTGLKGIVDTTGVVRLSWDPNKEMDLRGYTVLRADRPGQELTRRTKNELRETEFLDTINIKTFHTNVYYKLIASDLRYNESIPSDTLVLERPSKIPPTSPVFNAYELLGDTVLLKWTTSSSERLAKQFIYRKAVTENPNVSWENIYETEDLSQTQYKDVDTRPNTKYLYTITAMNQNGLESSPAPILSVITPNTLIRPKIKTFHANVDRENKNIALSWWYSQADVLEIQLFKKENEGEYTLYQTFTPSTNQFLDTKLIPNSEYGYGLKAVFADGSISEWSEIEITY